MRKGGQTLSSIRSEDSLHLFFYILLTELGMKHILDFAKRITTTVIAFGIYTLTCILKIMSSGHFKIGVLEVQK